MSVKSSASHSLVALLNTVGTIAQKTSDIVSTTAASVDMLDRFVQKSLDDQADRHLVHREFYRERIILEASREHGKLLAEIDESLAANPTLKVRFNENVERLHNKFNSLDSNSTRAAA